MLSGKYQAQFVDTWALGVLGFELMYADTPFSAQVVDDVESNGSAKQPATLIFKKIQRFKGFHVDCRHCDDNDEMADYANLVSRLMKVDPGARISTADAMKHSFLHQYEMRDCASSGRSRKAHDVQKAGVVARGGFP